MTDLRSQVVEAIRGQLCCGDDEDAEAALDAALDVLGGYVHDKRKVGSHSSLNLLVVLRDSGKGDS